MPPVSNYRRRGCVAIPTAVFCLLGTALAFAQDSTDMGDPWSGVEEMIVTGGNVLEALTSTSISVTAFDSADLAAFGASDVSDVAAFTPNL